MDLQWSKRNDRWFWKIGIKGEWMSSAMRQVHGKCCIVLQVCLFCRSSSFCVLFHFISFLLFLVLLHLSIYFFAYNSIALVDPKAFPYTPRRSNASSQLCKKRNWKSPFSSRHGFDPSPFKPTSYEIKNNNERIGEEETLDDRNEKNFLNGLVWLAWVHNGSVFTFSFFFFFAIYQK